METLRSLVVDLEALAHAARETLDRLPYMPRASDSEGQELEVRLNYGRLQALVTATATSAKDVLLACDQMLEGPHEPPDGDDDGGPEEPPDDDGDGDGNPEDDDGDGGPEEPSSSSGNGEPDLSASGHLPQAQAEHCVVEVSLDDIDDGPGLIDSGAPGAACTRQSRGGIMLDVAAGPPELVPLGSAGTAHVAFQPAASA